MSRFKKLYLSRTALICACAILAALDVLLGPSCGEQFDHVIHERPITRQCDERLLKEHLAWIAAIDRSPRQDVLLPALCNRTKPAKLLWGAEPTQESGLITLGKV
jgi:hypothetical protein